MKNKIFQSVGFELRQNLRHELSTSKRSAKRRGFDKSRAIKNSRSMEVKKWE